MKNNNTSIANDLKIVFQNISTVDKTDTYRAIATVQQAHNDIESISQEHKVPMLQNIVDWMSLNTEINSDSYQDVKGLLNNDSYAGWIGVIAKLLLKNDFTLLPSLHQSLTSPAWVVRPSTLLLKSIALWLTDLKIGSEQLQFDAEINIGIEHDINDSDAVLIHQISDQTEGNEKLIDDENPLEIIDEVPLGQLDVETEVAGTLAKNPHKFTEFGNNLLNSYQTLISASNISADVFLVSDLYKEELNRIALFAEISSLDAIIGWCQKNLVLFEANPTDETIAFIRSGLAWSWINELHGCFKNAYENTGLNNLSSALSYEEWLEPIDSHQLESLLVSLKNIFNNQYSGTVYDDGISTAVTETNKGFMDKNSAGLIDMSKKTRVPLSKKQKSKAQKKLPSAKKSNFQVTWDEDTHPELLIIYLEEVGDKIEKLRPLLKRISRRTADTEDKVLATRLAHTINGSSAIVGVTALSEFSYRLEALFGYSKNNELQEDLLNLLPEAEACLDSLFNAVKLQLDEPAGFLRIFNALDNHLINLEADLGIDSEIDLGMDLGIDLEIDNEQFEQSSTPTLPDAILNQNSIKEEKSASTVVATKGENVDEKKNNNKNEDTLDKIDFDVVEVEEKHTTENLVEESRNSSNTHNSVKDAQSALSSTSVLPSSTINQNNIKEETHSSTVVATETEEKKEKTEEYKDEGDVSGEYGLDSLNLKHTKHITENPIEKNNKADNSAVESQQADQEIVAKQLETSGFQLNWNDDTHPELLMAYLEETPTQINELVPLMSKISAGNASADERQIASRMAHTIKGGSVIVGITTLSEITYRLESVLDHSVKHQLPNKILTLLPKAAACLEDIFEAIQMQDDEPAEYFSIFKQLDAFVITMNDSAEAHDEVLELTTPVLPDFILTQNNDNKPADNKRVTNKEINEIVEEVAEGVLEKTSDQQNITEFETVEIIISKSDETEKLKTKNGVESIANKIDYIVMRLINIGAKSHNIEADLEQYSLELQRFDLLVKSSGYPELSLLSQWCQSNLNSMAQTENKEVLAFISSGEIWSWIEFVGAALSMPDDMSHLSSLSVELMREDWSQAIEMDDLQTVLLALRHMEEGISVDTEYVTANEDINGIVSWDKDIHPELLAVYFKETPDQIAEVAALLQKISKGDSTIEENKKASRIAHTIKGASGVVGLNLLLELTHSLEDILDYSITKEINAETAELLAEASDCMESLFETIQNKQAAPEELSSVLSRLSAFSLGEGDSKPTSVIKPKVEKISSKTEVSTTPLVLNHPSDFADIQTTKQETVANINESHIRVPIRIIDKLLNLAGELVTSSNQISDDLSKSIATNKTIKTQDDRVNNLLGELSSTISRQEKEQHKLLASLENSSFDSLEMDTYNELHSVASLLSESFLDSQEIDSTLSKQLNDLSEKLRSLDKLNKDFSDVILRSRMVSVDSIVPRLERIVRQTCRKTNKSAQLIVTGSEINIDTDILNGLIDPLLHMLRNSIDHGIESPTIRANKNKGEIGLIELSFTRDGNNILMSLKDDGAGINPDAVYKKAIEKELITANQKLSKKEILKLILVPGFSTQDNLTDISGRGVGMDVVNSSIRALNGTLLIDSDINQGSTFNLSIPLTLITSTTLLVNAAANIVALPIDTIDQIIYQEANNVTSRGGKYFTLYQDQELEVKSLAQLLLWSNNVIDFSQSSNILLIKAEKETHAIHVDNIISSREVVVKPLSPWISPVNGVIGACHLNDGGVAPVINLLLVANQSQENKQARANSDIKSTQRQAILAVRATPQILVVDDSLSNRKALSLIIDNTEYDVITAVDGMDALQIMNEKRIDLVFTDLEMPRMNGIELTQAIRAWDVKSKTPVVMITSRTTNKHRELAAKAGVDDYLTKPVATETLLKSIHTWLKVTRSIEA